MKEKPLALTPEALAQALTNNQALLDAFIVDRWERLGTFEKQEAVDAARTILGMQPVPSEPTKEKPEVVPPAEV